MLHVTFISCSRPIVALLALLLAWSRPWSDGLRSRSRLQFFFRALIAHCIFCGIGASSFFGFGYVSDVVSLAQYSWFWMLSGGSRYGWLRVFWLPLRWAVLLSHFVGQPAAAVCVRGGLFGMPPWIGLPIRYLRLIVNGNTYGTYKICP